MPLPISSPSLLTRHLRQGVGALLFAWLAAGWSAVQAMDWNALGDLARQRAQAPFQPVGDKLPDELAAQRDEFAAYLASFEGVGA